MNHQKINLRKEIIPINKSESKLYYNTIPLGNQYIYIFVSTMQLKKFTMMAIFANIMCFNFPILFVNSNLITESFESTVSCGLKGEKPWKYEKEPVILHGEKVLTTSLIQNIKNIYGL